MQYLVSMQPPANDTGIPIFNYSYSRLSVLVLALEDLNTREL